MIAKQNTNYIPPKKYLTEEELSPIKHEYIDGQVYAMAGASDAHVTISLNLASALRNYLRGSGYRLYMSDIKAHIETTNTFFYPNVMVTCDARDKALPNHKKYPCLIVEVLSESTEAFDRGDKFANYQQLPILQECVLINQKCQGLECFHRNAESLWVLHTYTQGSEIYLASINSRTSIDSLYEDVAFGENL
ncbi:MAG: Uma2 family endonuclease [Trichodesmium sp. MAG_R04]|nr:Uma2 family endonuclease [Trichodesmium sp. MAG_R04]